jgi:AraC family transcriptional regulator
MKAPDSKINQNAFDYYPALKRLQTYVAKHPSGHLSLADAAKIAAMEPTHFSKFFHKKTGVRFRHWEELRRVEIAISLFESADISVTDAGLNAGFNNLTTFERAFKRMKGITPRQYKKIRQAFGPMPTIARKKS